MIIRDLKDRRLWRSRRSLLLLVLIMLSYSITPYLPLFSTFVVEALVASIAVPGIPSLMKNLALV